MKYLATICLLTFTSIGFAQSPDIAQQRDASASLYERSITHEVSVINGLNQTATGLNAQNVGLLDNGHAMVRAYNIVATEAANQKADGDKQNAEAAKQIEYAAGVTQLVNTHNAACHGEVTQDVYNWCINVDAPRIAPSIATANEWGARVNVWKDAVNVAAAKVHADSEAVVAAEIALQKRNEAFLAEVVNNITSYNASVQRIQVWSEKLKALKGEFDTCKSSLDSHETFEKIHEVCGSMFDGNQVQGLETNRRIPDSTFQIWRGPSFCSDDGKYCVQPASVPEIMVLR